jgi:hypothetical protein
MFVVLTSHAVSTGLNYHHIMTGSVLLSSIAEDKCTKLKNTITHYVGRTCEQLIKHKFPRCATANLEISCLLEIDDISRIAVALRLPVSLVCPRRNRNYISAPSDASSGN